MQLYPDFIVDERRTVIRRLRAAGTVAEIGRILEEAGYYEGVDPAQRGRWHRVAYERRKELEE